MTGCHYCGSTDDTRPYGPGGTEVCFPCTTASPDRDARAGAAFTVQLDAAATAGEGTITLTERGPEPGIQDDADRA